MSMQGQTLPSFSIVMPCYNVKKFVRQAIKSVIEQQYEGDIQFVIVDDGSTDGTWELIQDIVASEGRDKNVVVVRHEENKGVSAATDTAYSYATGDWIVKADSDDIQLPGRCAAYADILQRHPGACAIVLSCQRMTEDEELLEKVPYCAMRYELAEEECVLSTAEDRFDSRMGRGNVPQFYDLGCTIAIKREVYLKWGGLIKPDIEGLRFSDDVVWGARYMMSGEVVGSKFMACLYRSRTSGNLEVRMQGADYSSLRRLELGSERGMREKSEAYRQAYNCCENALDNAVLSDWSGEMILKYSHKLKGFSKYFYARSQWWKWSWCKRVMWLIKNGSELHVLHRKWCFRRLVPLWLVCSLRSYVLRRRLSS